VKAPTPPDPDRGDCNAETTRLDLIEIRAAREVGRD
jgi:hypothetical protein